MAKKEKIGSLYSVIKRAQDFSLADIDEKVRKNSLKTHSELLKQKIVTIVRNSEEFQKVFETFYNETYRKMFSSVIYYKEIKKNSNLTYYEYQDRLNSIQNNYRKQTDFFREGNEMHDNFSTYLTMLEENLQFLAFNSSSNLMEKSHKLLDSVKTIRKLFDQLSKDLVGDSSINTEIEEERGKLREEKARSIESEREPNLDNLKPKKFLKELGNSLVRRYDLASKFFFGHKMDLTFIKSQQRSK